MNRSGASTPARRGWVTALLSAAAVMIGSAAIAAGGTISTVAGTGVAGYGGDEGPATLAKVRYPHTVSTRTDGSGIVQVSIADTGNHRIRRFTPGGAITAVAGLGASGYSGDGGPATSAKLGNPHDVAVDPAGNHYIADSSNHVIRKVDTAGVITTIAGAGRRGFGGDNGPATKAKLKYPKGVWADQGGRVYIADTNNNRIRLVESGTIKTVAGNGTAGYGGDGEAATVAVLNKPRGVAGDASGSLYIVDHLNNRIRRVLPGADGVVNGGPDETITTYAGTGAAGFGGDGGPAVDALLNGPIGNVALDASGNLYIPDSGNHRMRVVIAATATIRTVAGTGVAGYNGEGEATTARLNNPRGVGVDGSGRLFIADEKNQRIRQVTGF